MGGGGGGGKTSDCAKCGGQEPKIMASTSDLGQKIIKSGGRGVVAIPAPLPSCINAQSSILAS